jgi:hypothetical protein
LFFPYLRTDMRFYTLLTSLGFVILTSISCASLNGQVRRDNWEGSEFFSQFRNSVYELDIDALGQMMHFPFQTGYWIDGIDSLTAEEKSFSAIQQEEYPDYAEDIYNGFVQEGVEQASAGDLREIDLTASGSYYQYLSKLVDPGTSLWELYRRFDDPETGDPEFFGFVFGKIKGEFKVLAYHDPWPVRE